MRRKLVQQGAATLMVSLPRKWTKELNLKKGDEIEIEESGNDLVLSRERVEQKKTTKINLTQHTESSVRTALVNAYRAGYDRIEIVFQDEKRYQIILNTITDYIIGFDIIQKGTKSCIIENITEPSEDQFDVLFRKILYNIRLLIKGTEDRLKNKTDFAEFRQITYKIHQYDNFCRRVISKKHVLGNQANMFWTFLTLLIHGQRELYHLNKFLDNNKVEFKNFDILKKLEDLFELLSQGYIKKDLSMLEKIHALEKTIIYTNFYNAVQHAKKENIILYHLAACARNFYLASSPLIGLSLNQ